MPAVARCPLPRPLRGACRPALWGGRLYKARTRTHSALTAGCGRAWAQRRILVCGGLRVMIGAKWTRAADEKQGDKATRADEAAPQPWLSRPAAALAGPGQRFRDTETGNSPWDRGRVHSFPISTLGDAGDGSQAGGAGPGGAGPGGAVWRSPRRGPSRSSSTRRAPGPGPDRGRRRGRRRVASARLSTLYTCWRVPQPGPDRGRRAQGREAADARDRM